MRGILCTVLFGPACALVLAGQPAAGQPADKSEEVKKLEAELARLRAQIQTVEARLRKAREVVVAFTVKSERSLSDPTFAGILHMQALQNLKWGQDVATGPDLVIAVNKEAKTVFVKGQPEDIEAFRRLVVLYDELHLLGERGNH
jgi:hypothetical protein